MNTLKIRSIIITAAMFASSLSFVSASEASKADAAISTKMLTALQTADYAAFISDGTASFKKMKPEQFTAAVAKLGSKLKAGHEVSYLGELKQKGSPVTLWRVSFQDGSDDALVTMSVKNGQVGGFWIK